MLTDFPLTPDDLDADWLTSVLHHCETLPPAARVSAFTCDRLGGFASSAYRICLEYEPGQETSPASMVAKFTLAESEISEIMAAAFQTELYFYEHLAARVGIPVPARYFGAWDVDHQKGILLLEELVGYRSPYPDLETNPGADHYLDAAFIVKRLAAMHAAWWEHADLSSSGFSNSFFQSQTDYRAVLAQMWPEFLEKGGESVPEGIPELVEPLGKAISRIKEYLRSAPRTLRHNDFHRGNILLKDGSERLESLAVLDWQIFLSGRGARDLAYFLGLGTYKELRRKHQANLIELYHRTLVEHGVQRYSLEQCYRDYRISMLDVLYFCVTVITKLDMFSDQETRDIYLRIINNVSSAVLENGSQTLLTDFLE